MERNYVTIGFKFIDTFGNEYEQTSKVELCESFGYDVQTAMGEKMNAFMKQCGYVGFDKSTVLIESVTDEEADALMKHLLSMRENK